MILGMTKSSQTVFSICQKLGWGIEKGRKCRERSFPVRIFKREFKKRRGIEKKLGQFTSECAKGFLRKRGKIYFDPSEDTDIERCAMLKDELFMLEKLEQLMTLQDIKDYQGESLKIECET